MKSFTKNKISVLMTIYNAEDYVYESIKSIINQKYKNWEIIAIDDFSTDGTVGILKKIRDPRIKKFFLKRHIGRTNALNYGLKKAKGKYIAVLDADDISHTNRLYFQKKVLDENYNVNLVGTLTRLIDQNGKLISLFPTPKKMDKLKEKIVYENVLPHSSIMFRKKHLRKTGIYPKNLKYAQDYGLILKFFKTGNLFLIPKFLTECRILKTGMTNRKEYRLIKIKEEIFLHFFSLKNFTLNTDQKLKIYYRILKNYSKFFLLSLLNKISL